MRNSIFFTLIMVLLLISLTYELKGQGRPPGVGTGRSTSTTTPTSTENGSDLFGRRKVEPDTFDAQYFYLDNPFLLLDRQDTLLADDFAQPDPAFHGDYAFANLGNLGSPLTPLVYESKLKSGLNIGFNNFDNYYFKKEQLKFFKLKSAYTNATYSQGEITH